MGYLVVSFGSLSPTLSEGVFTTKTPRHEETLRLFLQLHSLAHWRLSGETYSLFPIPYSLVPIPYFLFANAYSLFTIPYSLMPIH